MSEYDNKAQRRGALKADCYFNRAQSEVGSELGGRFKHLTTTSVTPVPQYPQQPPNSPFHHDPTGAEPPLGYSVHDLPPVGTASEIAASIKAELQKAIEQGSHVARAPDALPVFVGPDPPLGVAIDAMSAVDELKSKTAFAPSAVERETASFSSPIGEAVSFPQQANNEEKRRA